MAGQPAPRQAQQRPRQRLGIDHPVFPALRPPAAQPEPAAPQQTLRRRFRCPEVQHIVQHAAFEHRTPPEGRHPGGLHPETIHAQGLHAIRKGLHPGFADRRAELRPVDPRAAPGHKERPVGQVAQRDAGQDEVHRHVAHQKKGVESRRRKADPRSSEFETTARFGGTTGEPVLEPAIRSIPGRFDEVDVVLNRDAVDPEGRVVSRPRSDPNPPLPGHPFVALGAMSEEPDVDVAARTVFRNRIETAQSAAFEHHHRNIMPGVEGGEPRQRPPLTPPAGFDRPDPERPPQPQRHRRSPVLGQERQGLPHQCRNPLPGRQRAEPLPHHRVARPEAGQFVGTAPQCGPQQAEKTIFKFGRVHIGEPDPGFATGFRNQTQWLQKPRPEASYRTSRHKGEALRKGRKPDVRNPRRDCGHPVHVCSRRRFLRPCGSADFPQRVCGYSSEKSALPRMSSEAAPT